MTALLEYLDLLQIQAAQNTVESMVVVLNRAEVYGDMVLCMVLDHFSATGVQ